MKRTLVVIEVLCLYFSLASCIAQGSTVTAEPKASPWEISAVFDKEIDVRGLEVVQDHISPKEQTVGGKKTWAWAAGQGSAEENGDGRSVKFRVTDERFRFGRQPAVDIEVVYKIESDVSVDLLIDGDNGSEQVATHYGGNKEFQTLTARVDGAFFGERQYGHGPHDMQVDGFDIRINAYRSDLYIRSIKIKGYDLDNQVDYQRLLKPDRIRTSHGGDDLLVFAKSEKPSLAFTIWNLSHRDLHAKCSYEVTNRSGDALIQESCPNITLKGDLRTDTDISLDISKLPYGIYALKVKFTNAESGETAKEWETDFGVYSGAAPAKAKEGEFLYGLDMDLGPFYTKPRLLGWADFMGVDIVRGGGFEAEKMPDADKAMAVWQQHNIQVLASIDPPKDMRDTVFYPLLDRKVHDVELVARKYKQIKYWELGNEPDLWGFFPGPIDKYIEAYTQMYKAIKRGNPNTVVGSGGLSFAGDEAILRAQEFVRKVDPQYVDAWVYHGHGPLVRAERTSYERMRKTAAEAGKDNKVLIETESGVAALDGRQEENQSRTAIEKMVFAQSVGEPLFIWFRLSMPEEGYTNLRTDQEPRPVVLAYRTMVEALRGYRFASRIDLGKNSLEAYLFEQIGGNGRTLVVWSNETAQARVTLGIAATNSDVRGLHQLDMYGNAEVLPALPNGTAEFIATEDPSFVKWETSAPKFEVHRAHGTLEAPAAVEFTQGQGESVNVEVTNPSMQPLTGSLLARVTGNAPLEVLQPAQRVVLSGGESRKYEVRVNAGRPTDLVRWPKKWTVFVPVDGKIDISKIQSIPASLPAAAGAGTVEGKRVSLTNMAIDLSRFGVRSQEKLSALVFGEVDSPRDQVVSMGAAADYWMAWFVNGQAVYDTMEYGNGGSVSILDHTFTIHLRAGRNLLSARVLSGTQGFKLIIGSPTDLEKAKHSSSGEGLALSFISENLTAQREIAVSFAQPLSELANLEWTAPIEQWADNVEPAAALDGGSVHNLWEKQPDSSKWWRGESDLSATAWMAYDATRVYLVVRVLDDIFVPPAKRTKMEEGDSLRFAISRDGAAAAAEFTVGLIGSRTEVFAAESALKLGIQAKVERLESEKETIYRIAIDRASLGSSFYLNLLVNDNDGGFPKQTMEWLPGMVEGSEVHEWHRCVLP
jgi:hypothetical protein